MTRTALIVNGAVAVVVVVAYTVLTIYNHDGTSLLTLLGGQGIAAMINAVTGKGSA